jgi:hypothetical protein
MQFLSRHSQLGICVFAAFLFFGVSRARSQSPAPDVKSEFPAPQCDPDSHSRNKDCFLGNLYLRGTSYDVAIDVCLTNTPRQGEPAGRKTCLLPLLQRLGAMPELERCGAKKIDELLLRQKITEVITTASLEVEGFLAQVDNESNHIREVKDHLSDQQSKHLSQSSLASNVASGGGAVGSALEIGVKTATAGNWVGAIFGGIGAAFGFVNYFETLKSPKGCFPTTGKGSCQPFICKEDGNSSRGCSPTMLYHVFNPADPVLESDLKLFHSRYDPVIENYLEDPSHNRRLALIASWKETKPGLSEEKEKAEEKEEQDRLTANQNLPMKLSIDELADRQSKLADLRTLVSRINRDLGRLTNDLATGVASCPGDDGN